jgi:DHA2 family multidrug resistance protein
MATIGLSLASFLIVLDYSVANVSIPYIAGNLGVSVDEGTYVITSFAIGNAIALPITGWLSRRFGVVRLMVLSILLFTLFSWICGASRALPLLVSARFIQGFVAGPMVPLSQTLLLAIFPPDKKPFATAIWATVIFVAPIIGPVLGGYLSYDYSWPWIFYINLPFGLLSAFIIHRLLHKDYETEKTAAPLDWVGLILLAIAVSSLQVLLDKGEQWDWQRSPLVRTLAVSSLISFAFLFVWEHFYRHPLLELRLLRIWSYTASMIFIFFVYSIYFGGLILIPLWLQSNMNYTPIWAGLAVAPIGIMPILCSTLIAKWVQKIGIIIPITLSFILFALSAFITSRLTTDADFFHIALTRFLFGCGWMFFITPLFILNVQDIPTDKLPSATGFFQFIRAQSGAIGTSIFTTIWIRRTVFQHSNVTTYLVPGAPNTDLILAKLGLLDVKGERALAVVNQLADNQAAMLALNDCFFLMAWIFLALMGLLPFLKTKKAERVVSVAGE